MVLFLLGDHQRHLTQSYVLPPYVERCAQLELQLLVRRRINATILFIHSIIMGTYNSPYLRSMITFNADPRLLRHPIIKINTYDNSPFNVACRIFNIAAENIDPTLSRDQFRTALMKLPDSLFGHWIAL